MWAQFWAVRPRGFGAEGRSRGGGFRRGGLDALGVSPKAAGVPEKPPSRGPKKCTQGSQKKVHPGAQKMPQRSWEELQGARKKTQPFSVTPRPAGIQPRRKGARRVPSFSVTPWPAGRQCAGRVSPPSPHSTPPTTTTRCLSQACPFLFESPVVEWTSASSPFLELHSDASQWPWQRTRTTPHEDRRLPGLGVGGAR